MGVGRVREVLRQLENEGIVEARERDGRVVCTALIPTELVGNLPYAVCFRMESVSGL